MWEEGNIGLGLKLSENILEVDKKDWIAYKGTYVPKRTATALKAWETRRVNKDTKKYQLECKSRQRRSLINLMDQALDEHEKYNLRRYSSYYPSVLFLESPKLLFLNKVAEHYNKKEQRIREEGKLGNVYVNKPERIYIPNKKQSGEIKQEILKNNGGKWYYDDMYYLEDFHCNIEVLPESYKEFMEVCEYGRQEDSRCFRHGTWIQNQYPSRFELCFIWADYCGGFSKHKKDIKLTFKSRLLCNHSIYALTFSTRDPAKKKTSYSTMNAIVAVQDYVGKIAKKYGYSVEFLTEQSGLYKHHMYTAVFRCVYEPIEKNLSELIEFLKDYDRLYNELKNRLHDIDKSIYGKDTDMNYRLRRGI